MARTLLGTPKPRSGVGGSGSRGEPSKARPHRGKVVTSPLAERVVSTIHPSSVLRAPDSEGRRAAYAMLVEDLKVVAKLLQKH